MNNRFSLIIVALSLMLLCPLTTMANEKVRLQLKWQHQFQFAGYYAAKEKGYYQAAGLDVDILPSQPGNDSVQQVIQGKAEFGVGSTDLLLLRERGAPVVALAVIFQHSPLALMTLKQGGQQSIHDLAGKKIMIEPGASELLAYLRKEGLSSDKFTMLPYDFNVKYLLAGNVDVMSTYVTDEPYELKKVGQEYALYSPRSGGIDFYGDNLFTTESLLTQKPELVKAFREASLKGWEYAIGHQEELVQLIYSRYSQQNTLEHLRYEARQIEPLLHSSLVQIGHMNPGRWRHISEIYAELGMLKPDFNFKGFLYDTNPPPQDMRWFYGSLAAALTLVLVASLIVIRFSRLSSSLKNTITERRRAEEELSSSLSLLNSTLESTAEGILATDSNGLITRWNQKFVDMWHVPESLLNTQVKYPVTNHLVSQMTQPEEYLCRVMKLYNTPEESSVDMLHLLDGRIFRRYSQPRKTGDEIVGRVWSYEDITDQKRAEDTLRESEERHRILFRDSPDAYLIIVDGVFVDCNRASENMLRCDRSQIIGQRPETISPEFQPDGSKSSESAEEKIKNALLSGSNSFEWVHRRSDGSDLFVEVSIASMMLDGNHALFTTWRDITERKQVEKTLARSEMKFRTLYNSTRDAVMLLDDQGFFDCNKATLDMFGADTQERFCSHHPGNLSPLQQPCGVDSMTLSTRHIAIAMEKGSHHFEWVHRRVDNGEDFPAEVLLSAMEFDGKPVLQATVRDISERRVAEKALEESARNLATMSITDGLTGIANRRHFDEVLGHEYSRHARSGAVLSLILLDIDYFKLFNDCYGHVSGDDCLRQIATVMAECTTRPADVAARYGGEEFACILPETDLNGAVVIAEKIRNGIMALNIPHKGSDVADCVTASLGVVSVQCCVAGSAVDIVAQADELLYKAKSSGRNRVKYVVKSAVALTSMPAPKDELVQLVWQDSFCSGNMLIDAQHQSLFNLANKLLEAVLMGRPAADVLMIISPLLDDVRQHFHDEETILKRIGYPGLSQHAAEHAKLLAKGAKLSQEFEADTLSVGDVFQFLVFDIVKQHMLGADVQFFPFAHDAAMADVMAEGHMAY